MEMKLRHGFFEFNSATYSAFTLSALLNLVDFIQGDDPLRDLAWRCVSKLLEGILAFALPDGSFFSVTGRGYSKQKTSGTGHDLNGVIYLLTGRRTSGASGMAMFKTATLFLASSAYLRRVSQAVLTQCRHPRPQWLIGPPLRDMVREMKRDERLHANRGPSSREQKDTGFVPFVWSMGAYFHPHTLRHTYNYLEHTRVQHNVKNLWDHPNFRVLSFGASFMGKKTLTLGAKALSFVSRGSQLTDQIVTLYKRGRVLLATVDSTQAGCVGFQKIPFIASVAGLPVWTANCPPVDGNGLHELVAHASLPQTAQCGNIAIVWYRAPPLVVSMQLKTSMFAHVPLGTNLTSCGGSYEFVPRASTSANKALSWLFLRVGDSFLGLGSARLRVDQETLHVGADSLDAAWLCVVGTSEDFGEYSTFRQHCIASSLAVRGDFAEATFPPCLCLDEPPREDIDEPGPGDQAQHPRQHHRTALTCVWRKDDETLNSREALEAEFQERVAETLGELPRYTSAPRTETPRDNPPPSGSGGGGGSGGVGATHANHGSEVEEEEEDDDPELEDRRGDEANAKLMSTFFPTSSSSRETSSRHDVVAAAESSPALVEDEQEGERPHDPDRHDHRQGEAEPRPTTFAGFFSSLF